MTHPVSAQQHPLMCCLDGIGVWKEGDRGKQCAGAIAPAVPAEVAPGPVGTELRKWDQWEPGTERAAPCSSPLRAIWLSLPIPVPAGRIPCGPRPEQRWPRAQISLSRRLWSSQGFASYKVWIQWSTLSSPKMHCPHRSIYTNMYNTPGVPIRGQIASLCDFEQMTLPLCASVCSSV